MKKVLINISVVSKNHRGMGVFTKNILLKLLANKDIEFVLVSCTDIDESLKTMIDEYNIVYKQVNTPLPFFEQFILPFLIKKYKVNMCWFPSNTFPLYKVDNVKYIATIHDVIFLDKTIIPKSIYQKIGKFYRAFIVSQGINKIDVLTSVSKSALSEINNYFRIDIKINNNFVLYNSINLNFDFDDNIIEEYKINNKKYIYTISGDAPHKNLEFLIKSFKKFNLIHSEYTLIISGVREEQHYLYGNNNIILTSFISDSEKNSLIKNASFFVFASLEEGFGIPLIEAMSLNKNVLASDIEIFKEIGKTYVSYFDPYDENFLINYIKKPIEIKKAREYIENNFNIIKTTKKLENIFNEFN